jgi:hypothetical protein
MRVCNYTSRTAHYDLNGRRRLFSDNERLELCSSAERIARLKPAATVTSSSALDDEPSSDVASVYSEPEEPRPGPSHEPRPGPSRDPRRGPSCEVLAPASESGGRPRQPHELETTCEVLTGLWQGYLREDLKLYII